MEQEAKGNKASVTTSSGCQRQFEEPYAGKPQVRFRGGAAAAMPTAYSTDLHLYAVIPVFVALSIPTLYR